MPQRRRTSPGDLTENQRRAAAYLARIISSEIAPYAVSHSAWRHRAGDISPSYWHRAVRMLRAITTDADVLADRTNAPRPRTTIEAADILTGIGQWGLVYPGFAYWSRLHRRILGLTDNRTALIGHDTPRRVNPVRPYQCPLNRANVGVGAASPINDQ